MTVHVVADSTSDLTAADAQALGVAVVPLRLRFGEETFRDGVDIDGDTFYTRLTTANPLPVTSQPTPNDFAEVYAALLADPRDRVVSVHLSSKWSGTLQSASLAAQEFGGRVACVDSLSISGGTQFVVRGCVRDAADGCDIDTVVSNAEARRDRVAVYVLLDTLSYLQKGGRIGRAQALLGGVLNVRPILNLNGGEVHPQARVRNRRQGVVRLLELIAAEGPLEGIAMMVSGTADQADEVRRRLVALYPELELRSGLLGPVVGVYAGPGAIGVAGLRAH